MANLERRVYSIQHQTEEKNEITGKGIYVSRELWSESAQLTSFLKQKEDVLVRKRLF